MEKATVGQFHDFFGRVLSKMSLDKIELIDKTKIQEVISLICSKETDERVINEFIRFINNGGRTTERLAQLFHGIKELVVEKYPDRFTIGKESIMEFFQPLINRELESGFPEPEIRSSLWTDFRGETVDGFNKDLKCFIYLVLYEMKLTKIIEMAEREMIMEVYPFIQGLSIIRQATKGGMLDVRNQNIIVTIKFPNSDLLFRLGATRDNNNMLIIDYYVVDYDYWSPGTLIALKPFQIL